MLRNGDTRHWTQHWLTTEAFDRELATREQVSDGMSNIAIRIKWLVTFAPSRAGVSVSLGISSSRPSWVLVRNYPQALVH